MKICPNEKLRNAFLAVKSQDASGSQAVSFPIPSFCFPQGPIPMTGSGTIGYIRLHSFHKNTGCSWYTLMSPVICISSGLADHLLTSVHSASIVSCSKVQIFVFVCHNLCALLKDKVIFVSLFNKAYTYFKLSLLRFFWNRNNVSKSKCRLWGKSFLILYI